MISPLAIPEVWLFSPRRFEDERGWFQETFSAEALRDHLGGVSFVQDNHSMTRAPLTLRGMHFQKPPKAQDKLVRVVRGSVLDVAVDLRRASPTYGKWVSATLSATNGAQLFVPKGFAHGFLTLEPDTEVIYKVSDYYSPEHEGGISHKDPAVGIDWGHDPETFLMKPRDAAFPPLAQLEAIF